jgi:hypothetical protein
METTTKRFDVQAIEIHVSREAAFQYVADPKTLPEWTSAFKSVGDGRASLETPNGAVEIGLEVKADATAGTIDWYLTFPDGKLGTAFSRVTPGGHGLTIFTFVLMPPPVALEQLEGALQEQIGTLKKELQALKSILESR